MTSNAALLQLIYDDEETDQIVYFVREELMKRVMSECNESYIKKQTINFVVQCAYDAIVKFLCINFYYHCPVPDTSDSTWTPDVPIKPSPRDTWAHSAVPIRSSGAKEVVDKEEGDGKLVSKMDTKETDFDECTCTHVCDCLYAREGIFKSAFQYPSSNAKPCPSRVKFSPKSSKMRIVKSEDKVDHNLNHVLKTRFSSETSDTLVSTYRSRSQVSRTVDSSKEGIIKRKKEKSPTKDPKCEIPPAAERGSQASVVKLPPIRVNTKFTSKAQISKKKKN